MKFRGVTAALLLAALGAPPALAQVVINEIHYDPPQKAAREEFVELYNAGGEAVDLSGSYLSGAIRYVFPPQTSLAAGDYLVVAENPPSIRTRFGVERVLGPYEGYLDSDGERVELRSALGAKLDEVDYGVGFPWPVDSAGEGSSMELIHAELENDLGGSWRAAGPPASLPLERQTLLARGDAEWRYRKGTSEASDPPSAWRELEFVEDETWSVGLAPIGFGDADVKTLLQDMPGGYTSVYLRRAFSLPEEGELPPFLKLLLKIDDGCIVWINGREITRLRVTAGEKAHDALGQNTEARWEERLLTGVRAYLKPGQNLLAIHAFNAAIQNTDFSVDAEVVIPARGELPPEPTPGERNSVYSENAPPQVRQVIHRPEDPLSAEPVVITAKVTDPDGVASVSLSYQVVAPGTFIPARLPLDPVTLMAKPTQEPAPNPAFEDPARWKEVPMVDDGTGDDETADDSLYTAVLPVQANRALVRYRITVTDTRAASARVPYPDDRSLNFAYFVYDGVPPYQPTRLTVHPEGLGHVYPSEVLTSLPVYHLITRSTDVAQCVAYNGAWQIPKANEAARDAFNWEGAFVYGSQVFDHVRFRLRQANDRYGGSGKRSWRLRFNRGHHLQAHDNLGRPYPTRWRTMLIGKMFDNLRVGNFGVTETLNSVLWNAVGVPAPYAHTFHFRVVDGPDEAPAGVLGQYLGDFWGMALAVEDYDPRFMEAHGLPDGNLYKLKDGIFDGNQLRRNQGRFSVTTDEDFQNIRRNLRPDKPDAWLDSMVRYERWFPYHTVVEAIRHYDFVPADSHSKNRAWFFEPHEQNRLGQLWTLPHDADASWGPNWNEGIDYSKQAIFSGVHPAFRREYRNFIRGFRDLLWQEEAINGLIDDLAAVIARFTPADRDRWRNAPPEAGNQDYGTLEAKVLDMKRFAFVAWSGPSGPPVPAGGRAKHLDNLSNLEGDAAQIPRTPQVVSTSPPGFPLDRLIFEVSPFSDPQGDQSFAGLEWRVGEVTDPAAPAFDPGAPRKLEWHAVWESGLLTEFQSSVQVPVGRLQPGRAYRVRARFLDQTLRFGHWSAPVQFIAGPPVSTIPVLEHLRVTEVMYNPADAGDGEFIEVQNVGPEPLDLSGVRFADGIEFAFEGSAVTSLAPGEYAVVVKDRAVFSAIHDTAGMKIAGEYSGKLENGGEELALVFGADLEILRFTYDDGWHPSTDGQGPSLVIGDPRGPRSLWSEASGWRPSAAPGGTPGRGEDPLPPPGGFQVPGDLNQDQLLDVADALGLLGYLFLGSSPTLACDGGDPAGPGNLALLDSNGDARLSVDDPIYLLGYLFLGGAPPALGTSCARIAGCPSACAP